MTTSRESNYPIITKKSTGYIKASKVYSTKVLREALITVGKRISIGFLTFTDADGYKRIQLAYDFCYSVLIEDDIQ